MVGVQDKADMMREVCLTYRHKLLVILLESMSVTAHWCYVPTQAPASCNTFSRDRTYAILKDQREKDILQLPYYTVVDCSDTALQITQCYLPDLC